MSKPKLSIAKRRQEKKQKRLARLKRKQGRSPFDSPVAAYALAGLEKMSTVLQRFVEPYLKECADIEDYRKLYGMAVVAWNAALVSEQEGASMVDDLIEKALPQASAADRQLARLLLQDMIDRKTAYFSAVKRSIVGFDLSDTGGGSYYLSVVSGFVVA
jgi:hypothetical protein